MAQSKIQKYTRPLHINGMDGRQLRLPAPAGKKQEILLLYGHHASIERMSGLAQVLNTHGAVTLPDLPGFGGMDSFYKISEKPTLDNYADYLASLIKLYYKRRKFTIIATSFSVPLVIYTLQKYPELNKKVKGFVSLAGFVHRDDFVFNFREYWGLRTLGLIFSRRIPAFLFRHIALTKPVISMCYRLVAGSHSKMKDADVLELKKRIAFEVKLWQMNDVRTRAETYSLMLTLDVCKGGTVNVPAYHITTAEDRYFDHGIVAQHLHVIFPELEVIPSDIPNHVPTIIATAKEAEVYIPKRIRTVLG